MSARRRADVEAAIEGDGRDQIAFNARYLQEALPNLDDEQLALEFPGPLSPGVLKPIGDDGLRPRHHAGPHAVLSGARSGRRARRCASTG